MRDPALIATFLTERFGLPLGAEEFVEAGARRYRLYPLGIESTQGFSIEVVIGWRSVEAQFLPGNFATSLVEAMRSSSAQQRAVFRTFARTIIEGGAQLRFHVNGEAVDPLEEAAWPSDWRSLVLKLERTPVIAASNDPDAPRRLAETWGGRMLGLALALLPVESEITGEEEGGAIQGRATRYERSLINRAACIEVHGARCKVCDLDFAKGYGPIGAGFIEVHHIEPVSGIEPGTMIDPSRDLVPLCSNCHSMAHRRIPPLGVDELKGLLRLNQKGPAG